MKFKNGAICAYSVSPAFTPKTPAQLTALAESHGVPTSICPEYAGDRLMVTRAISSTSAAARKGGWLVQSLDTGKDHVVYTIAAVEKDKERERADFTHEATIKWSSEGGNGAQVEGWHEVAQQVNTTYQRLRGLVLASDWTKTLVEYITGACQGISLKDNGHVWWVPPLQTPKLTALRGMLAEVGIALFISEIEAENVGDVQQVAQRGLAEQIEALREEVASFDGSQSAGVYRGRLTQLRGLRAKAMAYHNAVGMVLGDLSGVMGAIDTQVREMLTVRLNTVIHKDGTRETIQRPDVAAQMTEWDRIVAGGEQAMAQALLDGTVVIDCDDDELAFLAESDAQPDAQPDAQSDTSPEWWTVRDGIVPPPDLSSELAQEFGAPEESSDLPATW